MRDFRDAKLMAQALRKALADKNISISHSEALELVAKELGVADWNTLSAKLAEQPKSQPSGLKLPLLPASIKPLKRGTKMPLVPLRDIVVFPQMVCPLFIGRQRSICAAERVVDGDRRLLLVAQKNPLEDSPTIEGLYAVGVVAVLLQHMKAPDGNLHCWVQGQQRARVLRLTNETPFCEGEIAPPSETRSEDPAHKLARAVFEEFLAYAKANIATRGVWQPLSETDDPGRLADAISASLAIPVAERQELLETMSVKERLEKIRAILMRERAAA